MTPTSARKPQQKRASALPPDERRRAIVDAVIPLLIEHGADVTTRQIAAAAGVAEGTLFRVFDDKTALLHAAVHTMLDPERTRRWVSEFDRALPLDVMVTTLAEHMLARMSQIMGVMVALRGTFAAPSRDDGPALGAKGPPPGPPAFLLESQRALLESLTELFGRYRDELRVEPDRAAVLLRALVFGSQHPGASSGQTLTGHDIATVLLTGIRWSAPPEDDVALLLKQFPAPHVAEEV